MGIDLLIGFILTYIVIAIWKGGEALSNKSKKNSKFERERKAWEADKTNIDPVNGDYTSKYDGQRYDKDGCLKWRE